MPYKLLATTTAFEAEIRRDTNPDRSDFFEGKDRSIARAQAIGALEAHGRRTGFGGTAVLLAKVRDAETAHANAVARKDDRERHVEELVSTLYGYALSAHRSRWLTWWAVAAACASVMATLTSIVVSWCGSCAR